MLHRKLEFALTIDMFVSVIKAIIACVLGVTGSPACAS